MADVTQSLLAAGFVETVFQWPACRLSGTSLSRPSALLDPYLRGVPRARRDDGAGPLRPLTVIASPRGVSPALRAEQHERMPRDEHIGADTSGRSTDIGGSHSGGVAGDDPADAMRDLNPDVEPDTSGDPDQSGPSSGTPDDLKPGKRRTIGQDEDAGASSGIPGETASD